MMEMEYIIENIQPALIGALKQKQIIKNHFQKWKSLMIRMNQENSFKSICERDKKRKIFKSK